MAAGPAPRGAKGAPILCTGIAVRDLVFTVDHVPPPGMKVPALGYRELTGGNAANAAVGLARLGAAVHFVGPFGAADDPVSDAVMGEMTALGINLAGSPRVNGTRCPVSSILIDAHGERTIATYRHPALMDVAVTAPETLVADCGAVVADNKYPRFSAPLCAAGRARGVPVVLDADRALDLTSALARAATVVVFSVEGLQETFPGQDLITALAEAAAGLPEAVTGVTEGEKGVVWLEGGRLRRQRPPEVKAVDTLGAGDVFHGALALALSERQPMAAAMAFASAAAALKCRAPGSAFATPPRAEVEAAVRELALG